MIFYLAAAASLLLWLLVLALRINARFTNGISWMRWDSNGDVTRASLKLVVVRTFPGQFAVETNFVRGDMNGWNDSLFAEYGQRATRFGYFHEVWPLSDGLQLHDPTQMNRLERLGFDFSSEHGVGGRSCAMVFPNWFPMILLAILPGYAILMAARSLKRRAIAPAGRCRHCGYDLRATPDRCPECGTVREK
jgi:hypothetical protein